MNQPNEKKEKSTAFIDYLFTLCERDKGAAARLRRADNPATEYQSWDVLAAFNVNLEWACERLAYTTVMAAVARSRAKNDGELDFGKAIAKAFDDGANSPQASRRLMRLLACDDVEEVCRVLRSLLKLIQSRVSQPVNYAALLNDLIWFNYDAQRVKARWAQQFYQTKNKDGEGSVA